MLIHYHSCLILISSVQRAQATSIPLTWPGCEDTSAEQKIKWSISLIDACYPFEEIVKFAMHVTRQ